MDHKQAPLHPNETDVFAVTADDSLSIQDLIGIHQSGGAVMRTPHSGNAHPYNLGVAATGIPLVVHDWTHPSRDSNYHPGKQIVNGKAVPIIDRDDVDRLVPYIKSTGPAFRPDNSQLPEDSWAKTGEPLVDVHMRALRRSVPNANATTTSQFLLDREARSADIFHALANANLGSWRYVNTEGMVSSLDGMPAELVRQYGLFNDGSERGQKSGMLPPVSATIVAMAIHDAIDHDVNTVYHLSGPDMIHYATLPDIKDEMQAMYDAARSATSLAGLPERLGVVIVPTVAARLVTGPSRHPQVSALLNAYHALGTSRAELQSSNQFLADIETNYKDLLKYGDEEARELSIKARNKSKADRAALRQTEAALASAVGACAELFLKTAKGSYPTQYDAIASGEVPQLHPGVLATPLGQLAVMDGELEPLAAAYNKKKR